MTVVELLIALAVVGLLVWAATAGLRRVRKSDLRHDTVRVAAALRTAYSLATRTGVHHRVLFDLDQQTFVIEECPGSVKLRREVREELDEGKDDQAGAPQMPAGGDGVPEVQDAESPEQAAERAAALAGTRVGAARCHPAKLLAAEDDDDGPVRHIKTGRDIKIKQITVQHLEEPQSEGKVSINFFPLGYAEKAVVEIMESEDDEQYTLVVYGLTGRVEFHEGEWVKADEHMMRNGAGERVEER